MNRVCRRDLPPEDKSRKDPTSTSSVRAARDNGGSSSDGGTSPTAVLLAFLDVSLLTRGIAEGNRGRGLTVTRVGRVEGGGMVDEGNGIILDVAAGLGRLVPGGYASASFAR